MKSTEVQYCLTIIGNWWYVTHFLSLGRAPVHHICQYDDQAHFLSLTRAPVHHTCQYDDHAVFI